MKDLTNYVGFFFKKGGKSKKGSGIHIKKSHEGLFTKKAKAAGYGVQEYARHVLANKGSYDSATVKQANFARNATGWKHEQGGVLRPVLKAQLGLQVPGKYIDDVRLDFSRFIPDKVNGEERYVNPDNMSKIQDMLIEAGVPYTQRIAILSSILQESGGDPNATSKTGKYRGLLQWDITRMPTILSLEEQVKKIIDEINDTDARQFTDGGSGGPYVATAKSGREQFMKSTDPYAATVLFNKTYVRPKEQQSWYNRANQAAAIHNILGSLNDQKLNESWNMPDWVYGIEQTGGYGYKSPEPVGQFGRGGRVVPMWRKGTEVQQDRFGMYAYGEAQKKIDSINKILNGFQPDIRKGLIDALKENFHLFGHAYDKKPPIQIIPALYSVTKNPRDYYTLKSLAEDWVSLSKYLLAGHSAALTSDGQIPILRLHSYSKDEDKEYLWLVLDHQTPETESYNLQYLNCHPDSFDFAPFYIYGSDAFDSLIQGTTESHDNPITQESQSSESSQTAGSSASSSEQGQTETSTSTQRGSTQTTETKGKTAKQTTTSKKASASSNLPQYVYAKGFLGQTTLVPLVNGAPVMSAPKQTVVPAATQLSPEDIAYKDTLMRALNPQAFEEVEEVLETPTVALTRHQAKRTSNGKKVRVDGKRVQLAQHVGRGYQNIPRKGTENRDYIVWTNNEI